MVVPPCVHIATIAVIGAKGGKTAENPGTDFKTLGGDGAWVSGLLLVTPGEALVIGVGGYGGKANSNAAPGPGGWGPTGNGGRGGGGTGTHCWRLSSQVSLGGSA